jgi:hypothetical protein
LEAIAPLEAFGQLGDGAGLVAGRRVGRLDVERDHQADQRFTK